MRSSNNKINKLLKRQIDDLFLKTILDLKNPVETEDFVNDFLTESERDVLAKRLGVAYWLKKGRSYANIKENLKVSSATISSVQGILKHKGVENALKKMEAEEWASQWTEKIKKFVRK